MNLKPTDKPMWPFGKDNPNCICGDLPNANCPVHVTQYSLIDTGSADDWLDDLFYQTIDFQEPSTFKAAIQAHIQEAVVAARIDQIADDYDRFARVGFGQPYYDEIMDWKKEVIAELTKKEES